LLYKCAGTCPAANNFLLQDLKERGSGDGKIQEGRMMSFVIETIDLLLAYVFSY